MKTITTRPPDEGKSDDDAAIVIAAKPNQPPALTRTSKSLADLERAASHYPEPIRTETLWLQGFYLDHCQGNPITLRAIACKLGHDRSKEYFYNLVSGYNFRSRSGTWKEGGDSWSRFLEMVAALRRHAQQLARVGQLPFVQTPTYQCIADFITAKRSPSAVCRIGGIIAPTGGQTSESFKFYRTLNNHGAVIHVEAPANGRLSALQGKILEAYHVSGNKIERMREAGCREQINETRCIIIDNAQVLYSAKHGDQQPAFNWIREIYDDKRPTIILKFTEEFMQDLAKGDAKGYFEQFIGRMGGLNSILRLPAHAPQADLDCIADAFGISGKASIDLLYKWSRQQGRIRIVFDRIQLALEGARMDGRSEITLDDLLAADAYVPPAVGTFVKGGAT